MFGTIRDIIKDGIIVTIVVTDTTFADCKILDVDDLFIKFEYPLNGFTYVYPLEAIIHIRYPTSP